MKNRNILISGSGIAGATLAFWLKRHGFNPTIVERKPDIPSGGYMMDFWGLGYDVAEKMDLLPELERVSYHVGELVFIGDRGQRVGRLNMDTARGAIDGRMVSLLRSKLAQVLYDKTSDSAEYIFGEEIAHLKERENDVEVTLSSGGVRHFDLVIGTDGLHSAVRSLAFDDVSQAEKYFGYYVSCITCENFLPNDLVHDFVMYSVPNKQISVYANEGKLTTFFMFKQENRLRPTLTVQEQKDILRKEFGGEKWEAKRLLDKLDDVDDFYFDSVSQVKMDAWRNGRAALVGDACFAPSLLSGQGAALAMAGAYVLAGELKEADGDHETAFANYEKIFKPFVTAKQETAKKFMNSFIPPTNLAIHIRNLSCPFLNFKPVANWYWKRYLVDNLTLKDYT